VIILFLKGALFMGSGIITPGYSRRSRRNRQASYGTSSSRYGRSKARVGRGR
jgi:hypothetical protein